MSDSQKVLYGGKRVLRRLLLILLFLSLVGIPFASRYALQGQAAPLPPGTVSITGISVNVIPGNATVSGVATLSGDFTGTVTLIGQSHLPGDDQFNSTGGTATVTFAGTSSASYSLVLNPVSGANAYRVAVQASSPIINGLTTKSNSFEVPGLVVPTETSTSVPTSTSTATSTAVPTSTSTATRVSTATRTSVPQTTSTSTVVPPTGTASATVVAHEDDRGVIKISENGLFEPPSGGSNEPHVVCIFWVQGYHMEDSSGTLTITS